MSILDGILSSQAVVLAETAAAAAVALQYDHPTLSRKHVDYTDNAAVLSVVAPDGKVVLLQDRFILTHAGEVYSWRHAINYTFGAPEIAAAGRENPLLFSYTGKLLINETAGREEFVRDLERRLRSSAQVDSGWVTRMVYRDRYIEGHIVSVTATPMADTPNAIDITFTMFVTTNEFVL